MSDNEEVEMSEEAIIGEAVYHAIKAFDDYLSNEHGIDVTFFSKRIVIRSVSSDCMSFLKEYIFDDRGSYGMETE